MDDPGAMVLPSTLACAGQRHLSPGVRRDECLRAGHPGRLNIPKRNKAEVNGSTQPAAFSTLPKIRWQQVAADRHIASLTDRLRRNCK